ncbi:MAG: exo-alpha-sialidase [Candidatus Hydrogenedentes bacterium]|nr:exo-alpha-sialidase [Candidatus Hydrogenedentota bacterium]
MQKIAIEETGILYRNPIPHVRSVQAYFPSLVSLAGGELIATIALGEAFEAVNLHTNVCRSTDHGKTWTLEGPIYPGTKERVTSDVSRLTALPNGDLVAFMVRHDRTEHLNEGLTNTDNLGFVPTELLLLRSHDRGRTWSRPETLNPPLIGPSFELCSPIVILRDGRWLLPTSTWQGWDGSCPNGIRTVALFSRDSGSTWPEWRDIMIEQHGRVHFWESKVVEMADGRLLAVAWTYDADAGCDRENHFATSEDGGETWSHPTPTGLHGQTPSIMSLADGSVLCVYRRMDAPGLWANVSHLDGGRWVNDYELPLWGAQTATLTASTGNMSQNFATLRFGAPCITRLEGGHILVAFWCYEEGASAIRWYRLAA